MELEKSSFVFFWVYIMESENGAFMFFRTFFETRIGSFNLPLSLRPYSPRAKIQELDLTSISENRVTENSCVLEKMYSTRKFKCFTNKRI